ncbi:MAG: hypothetical protein P4L31_00575 [Candidatus Babeliales bacterium]|nr:hypothetical protein [Candidatus Babeliales bacterium]
MNIFYLIACLSLPSVCFGAQEKSESIKKRLISSDGKYLRIPTSIKELLAAKTIDENGLHELTSFLSENNGELRSVESVDINDISLLMHAVESKHEQARHIIYSFKPDFNRLCKGRSALFHAVASSNLESVQVMTELIKHKADINTTWEQTTLKGQINAVLKEQYANMASKCSPQNRMGLCDENKELKKRALKLIELFATKEKLLAQAQQNNNQVAN